MMVLSIFSHNYSVFFKTKNAEKLGLFLLFQRKIFISGYLAVNQFLGVDQFLPWGRLGGGSIACWEL